MQRPTLASSLRGYRREWFTPDLTAAATLFVIAVPEQLATSRLAGMPPITGLYAFIAGTVMFALLGSSRLVSVGADSTIAPLFAAGLGAFAVIGSSRYVDLVTITAVIAGVLVVAVWLLRLGWIAEFLSEPIIAGFLAGIGVVIVVHQLPALLGIPGGGTTTLGRLHAVIDELGSTCGWTVAIGLGVFATVIVCNRIDRRIPGALLGLVAATILVKVLDLQDHGVAILGEVAHGVPAFGLRGVSWHALRQVAPVAATVALVTVTQTAATSRAFASAAEPRTDVGLDFLGVGAGSVLAGLSGAFPVDASPPRTTAVSEAGGRSQLSGLLTAGAIIALIPAAGVLHDVPEAALAGILLFIATRIVRIGELREILRFDRLEFALAITTMLTVALVGVEQGIGVAVALAILDRTRISAKPQVHVLGRVPQTTSWTPIGGPEGAAEVPGVLVVLFATPLWYANAVHFRAQVREAIANAPDPRPQALVLDALGMSDIDYTGVRELRSALDELDAAGIQFAIARAGARVRDELERAGLTPDRVPQERFYPDVDAAVVALTVGRAPGGPVSG